VPLSGARPERTSRETKSTKGAPSGSPEGGDEMPILDLFMGPKCADCQCRIKGTKFPLTADRWLCPPCKNKREEAEREPREDEAERKRREKLILMSQEGRLDAVVSLLENRGEVNAKDQRGLTPLHLAAQNGHQDVVALLLFKGADVKAETRWDGEPPLSSRTSIVPRTVNSSISSGNMAFRQSSTRPSAGYVNVRASMPGTNRKNRLRIKMPEHH